MTHKQLLAGNEAGKTYTSRKKPRVTDDQLEFDLTEADALRTYRLQEDRTRPAMISEWKGENSMRRKDT